MFIFYYYFQEQTLKKPDPEIYCLLLSSVPLQLFGEMPLKKMHYHSNMIGFPHCDIILLPKLQPGGLQIY